MKQASNYYAPDGFRYGVRHQDGSVSHHWNGRTQRAQAFRTMAEWHARALAGPFAKHHSMSSYVVVRHAPGQPWHPVCEYADPGTARCPEAICDCFYDSHPEDPFGLHPEDFRVL